MRKISAQSEIFSYYVGKSGYAQEQSYKTGHFMKKTGILLLVFLFLLIGLFVWLLGKSHPSNANSEIITIELQDDFET